MPSEEQLTRLTGLLEAKSLELYPDAPNQQYSLFEEQEMLQEIHDAVYEENPEVFDGIDWLDSDLGLPLWVRPGAEWIPAHELEDDDYELDD
jgi:hypothetical protein